MILLLSLTRVNIKYLQNFNKYKIIWNKYNFFWVRKNHLNSFAYSYYNSKYLQGRMHNTELGLK